MITNREGEGEGEGGIRGTGANYKSMALVVGVVGIFTTNSHSRSELHNYEDV